MSGGLSIGRIYERKSVVGPPLRTWLINGVGAPSDVMKTAGAATDFEQAEATLKENWRKWLAWAGLREVDPTPIA